MQQLHSRFMFNGTRLHSNVAVDAAACALIESLRTGDDDEEKGGRREVGVKQTSKHQRIKDGITISNSALSTVGCPPRLEATQLHS